MQLSSAMVPFEGETICGFVIVGDSRSEALSVAEIALTHYETPGPKESVDLNLTRNAASDYDLVLRFGSAGKVAIFGINQLEIEPMLNVLPNSPGYFVCLGAMNGNNVQLVESRTFFLVKHDLMSLGKLIMLPFRSVDWEVFKDGIDATG